MHWLVFAMLSAVALIAQVSVAPRLTLEGARPDWLISLVVLVALHARRSDAAIAAWSLGFAADIFTLERTGILALTYLAVALSVASVQDYFFRYHRLTLAAVVVGASIVVRLVWLVYRYTLYGSVAGSVAQALLWDCLFGALYTGLWAMVVHWLLASKLAWFGARQPRYRYTGLTRA